MSFSLIKIYSLGKSFYISDYIPVPIILYLSVETHGTNTLSLENIVLNLILQRNLKI